MSDARFRAPIACLLVLAAFSPPMPAEKHLLAGGDTGTRDVAPLVHLHGQATKIDVSGVILSRRETTFDPKTGVWSVFFDPEGAAPASTGTSLILNFYGWDPPTAPLPIAQAWTSRSGSYRTIFKFQAPDPETKAAAYYILFEDIRAEKGYGYADITKISAAGNGAYAITFSHKIPGKDADEIERNIRAWIKGPAGQAAERTTSNISVDSDWREQLSKTQ